MGVLGGGGAFGGGLGDVVLGDECGGDGTGGDRDDGGGLGDRDGTWWSKWGNFPPSVCEASTANASAFTVEPAVATTDWDTVASLSDLPEAGRGRGRGKGTGDRGGEPRARAPANAGELRSPADRRQTPTRAKCQASRAGRAAISLVRERPPFEFFKRGEAASRTPPRTGAHPVPREMAGARSKTAASCAASPRRNTAQKNRVRYMRRGVVLGARGRAGRPADRHRGARARPRHVGARAPPVYDNDSPEGKPVAVAIDAP